MCRGNSGIAIFELLNASYPKLSRGEAWSNVVLTFSRDLCWDGSPDLLSPEFHSLIKRERSKSSARRDNLLTARPDDILHSVDYSLCCCLRNYGLCVLHASWICELCIPRFLHPGWSPINPLLSRQSRVPASDRRNISRTTRSKSLQPVEMLVIRPWVHLEWR